MPFSLWVTSHRRYEQVRAGAPDRLTLDDWRTCLDLTARARPVQLIRRPDGATWLFRRGVEPAFAPWLMGGLRPNNGPRAGSIQLSVSRASPHFLANMHELLTLGAFLNEELGLNVFEEAQGFEVSVETLGRLTDAQGEYALGQGRLWREHRRRLHVEIRMPLELPAGQQDDAPNLLALRLKHPKLPPLAQLLAAPPEGQGVEVEGDRGVWFDHASQEPVTWFMLNPHAAGELILWPQWGQDPFLQTARDTFAVAERLRERAGGEVLWNGQAATPQRTAWLRRYPDLLAVELIQLVEAGWEPSDRQTPGGHGAG